MDIAKRMEDKKLHNLPLEVVNDEYLNDFAEIMMELSNALNDEDTWLDDIKEDYQPAIQEFILNITGL